MACDISKIIDKLNRIMDPVIIGKAASITREDDGIYAIKWSDTFKIKTKQQSVRVAQQKIEAAHKAADEAGFQSKTFGPYLGIDSSNEDRVLIYRLKPLKLTRALELRNEAEDKEAALSEMITEKDKEFFAAQEEDAKVLAEQADNKEALSTQTELKAKLSLVDEAKTYVKDIKNDIYRTMFSQQPEELLKFIAEQYYGVTSGQMSNIAAASESTITTFGKELVDIATEMYPLKYLLRPNGLPPIQPTC